MYQMKKCPEIKDIKEAVKGNPIAIHKILEHYKSYILKSAECDYELVELIEEAIISMILKFRL